MWEVQQKISEDRCSVEICAISSANEHGKRSWGWHNPNEKFIVLSVHSLYQKAPLAEDILVSARKEAQRICDEKNSHA
ncbi:hypothetical protein [Trabulsiella guamensis]|uniref:hypothetical protein n=1 Tax=Trabulsiella guamensis TaxID=158852 RepID=UPI0012EC51DA|nr:hypothetical protein [Trabulsiella guamensis]